MKLSLMQVKAAVSRAMFDHLPALLGCQAVTWYKSWVFMNWEKLS
jgi:hypothetical protein